MRSWPMLHGILVVAAIGLAAPGTLRAARVTGTITGGPPPVTQTAPDGYGKFRRGTPGGSTPAPHPLIVIFEPVAGNAPPPAPPSERPVMDQRDERFVPRALVVTTGTTVDFLNSDNYYHNVFSLSAVRKFDLGRYRKGASRSVTFSKPGLVKLFCDIHPNMIGYILVTDSPWFGSMTPGGKYEIPDVPAGSYAVSIWHERLNEPVGLTTVEVGGEESVEINLTVPPS
jgi:plastocyanin